jgi:hypothetical protein
MTPLSCRAYRASTNRPATIPAANDTFARHVLDGAESAALGTVGSTFMPDDLGECRYLHWFLQGNKL